MSTDLARLTISDEVRALLSPEELTRTIAARNHTELTCPACSGTIAPEDDTPVTVVVTPDLATGRVRLQYAHATCSPSVIRVPEAMSPIKTPANGRRTVRAVHPRAVVVIDHVAGPASALLPALADRGFVASEDGVLEATGEPVEDVVLVWDGTDLVLMDRVSGLEMNRLYDSPEVALWTTALLKDNAAFVVMGPALGLDRFDPARVDALLADGKALGAVVRLQTATS